MAEQHFLILHLTDERYGQFLKSQPGLQAFLAHHGAASRVICIIRDDPMQRFAYQRDIQPIVNAPVVWASGNPIADLSKVLLDINAKHPGAKVVVASWTNGLPLLVGSWNAWQGDGITVRGFPMLGLEAGLRVLPENSALQAYPNQHGNYVEYSDRQVARALLALLEFLETNGVDDAPGIHRTHVIPSIMIRLRDLQGKQPGLTSRILELGYKFDLLRFSSEDPKESNLQLWLSPTGRSVVNSPGRLEAMLGQHRAWTPSSPTSAQIPDLPPLLREGIPTSSPPPVYQLAAESPRVPLLTPSPLPVTIPPPPASSTTPSVIPAHIFGVDAITEPPSLKAHADCTADNPLHAGHGEGPDSVAALQPVGADSAIACGSKVSYPSEACEGQEEVIQASKPMAEQDTPDEGKTSVRDRPRELRDLIDGWESPVEKRRIGVRPEIRIALDQVLESMCEADGTLAGGPFKRTELQERLASSLVKLPDLKLGSNAEKTATIGSGKYLNLHLACGLLLDCASRVIDVDARIIEVASVRPDHSSATTRFLAGILDSNVRIELTDFDLRPVAVALFGSATSEHLREAKKALKQSRSLYGDRFPGEPGGTDPSVGDEGPDEDEGSCGNDLPCKLPEGLLSPTRRLDPNKQRNQASNVRRAVRRNSGRRR